MTNGFRSRLANELQAFLDFKRSLGIQYVGAESMLRRFDRFVAETFKGRKPMDLKMAIEGWLATFHCRPVTITNSVLVIRKFCLFLRRRDPNSFVPDRDLAPRVYESHYLPHIFSPAEIRILLDEIGKMQHPFRSRTYRALLLILYCTGLRTGEAVRLRIRDVDLQEKVLHVEVSKAKSRWVPFEETLASELSDYLLQRSRINPASEDSRFLVQPNGSPCGRPIVSNAIIVRDEPVSHLAQAAWGRDPTIRAIPSPSIGSPSGTVTASTCKSVWRGCPPTLVTTTCSVRRTIFS